MQLLLLMLWGSRQAQALQDLIRQTVLEHRKMTHTISAYDSYLMYLVTQPLPLPILCIGYRIKVVQI